MGIVFALKVDLDALTTVSSWNRSFGIGQLVNVRWGLSDGWQVSANGVDQTVG